MDGSDWLSPTVLTVIGLIIGIASAVRQSRRRRERFDRMRRRAQRFEV